MRSVLLPRIGLKSHAADRRATLDSSDSANSESHIPNARRRQNMEINRSFVGAPAALTVICALALGGFTNPDGHFKFLHPWPGQIPPGQDSEECLSVG